MKEPYIAPEAELICFRPIEGLMTGLDDPFTETMQEFEGGEPTSGGDIEFPEPSGFPGWG